MGVLTDLPFVVQPLQGALEATGKAPFPIHAS